MVSASALGPLMTQGGHYGHRDSGSNLGSATTFTELSLSGLRVERRPRRLNLDVYPYLPRARVETTLAKAYMGLLGGEGP